MKYARLIALLVLIGLIGSSGCSGDSPRTSVAAFYTLYINLHPVGLPTPKEEQAMAPYLSKRLLNLIDTARLCQETFIRKYPEDKPPWADGCLFASLFEGPTQFTIINLVENSDGTSTVRVHFKYEAAEWEDLVIVCREADKFVIDDFIMLGAGEFNPPRQFSKGLECPDI